MKTLDQIGVLHEADKSSLFHDYLTRYEPLFSPLRQLSIHLLEIGVDRGSSMRVWRDYFENGEIVGLDNNPEACKHDLGPSVKLIHGDATSMELWGYLKSKAVEFDVVVDDGGHFSHQISSAFRGAWPLLKRGGLYIIEDTHAQYANEDGESSPLWPWLMSQVHWVNEHGKGQCGRAMPDADTAWIQISKSLVIIKKAAL